MMTAAVLILAAINIYLLATSRHNRVQAVRAAERAVLAAVAAKAEREAAGRIAGQYGFDGRGAQR